MKLMRFRFLTKVCILFFILAAQKTWAICPLCTIAVGAGVGLSRWLGIDDTISGIWIGGLIVSVILWTIFWFDKKKIHFGGRNLLVVIGYYLIVVIPLYYNDIVNHPLNRLWGMNKLILGILLGSLVFLIGSMSYILLKKHNNNHAYFPFQKVVMPISPLIIFSLIFYFITR